MIYYQLIFDLLVCFIYYMPRVMWHRGLYFIWKRGFKKTEQSSLLVTRYSTGT